MIMKNRKRNGERKGKITNVWGEKKKKGQKGTQDYGLTLRRGGYYLSGRGKWSFIAFAGQSNRSPTLRTI